MLSSIQAAARTAAVARDVMAARPDWIFKKCDSVLRGPVLAEARAVAGASGAHRILLIPANPSRGRTIRSGRYYINAQPLHETAFAHDLIHPRQTAEVATLLGGDLAGVSVPEVQSRRAVVEQARQMDSSTLAVGAADFFTALLELRFPSHRAIPSAVTSNPAALSLLVCGSATAWPQRKSEAMALNIPVFEFPHDIAALARALRAHGRALLGIGDGPGIRQVAPVQLSRELAISVVRVLQETAVPRLLLEGGATAAAAVSGARLDAIARGSRTRHGRRHAASDRHRQNHRADQTRQLPVALGHLAIESRPKSDYSMRVM